MGARTFIVVVALAGAACGSRQSRPEPVGDTDVSVAFTGDGLFAIGDVTAAGDGAIVVGTLRGAVDPFDIAPAVDTGVLLALDASGQPRWSLVVDSEQASDIAQVASSTDAIALASHVRGAARLGQSPIATRGQPGAVISLLDRDGTPRWHQAISSDGYAVVTALAFAGPDQVLAAGYYGGSLIGPPRLSSGGSLDAWVAALDAATGEIRWMHRGGGPGADTVHDVLADGDQALVAGSFHAWADFGPVRLEDRQGGGAGYVARVGPGGFETAVAQVAGASSVARALVRSDDGVAVAIESEGSLGGVEGIGGASAISIVQLNSQLGPSWSIRMAGPEPTGLAALVDIGDGLAVIGHLQGTIDIAGLGNLSARNGRDVFVCRLSTDGTAGPAQIVSAGHGDETAIAASALADRSVVIAGQLSGDYAIGTVRGRSAGQQGGFLIRTRPN